MSCSIVLQVLVQEKWVCSSLFAPDCSELQVSVVVTWLLIFAAQNELTGEHSCIMLRCVTEDSAWLDSYTAGTVLW